MITNRLMGETSGRYQICLQAAVLLFRSWRDFSCALADAV